MANDLGVALFCSWGPKETVIGPTVDATSAFRDEHAQPEICEIATRHFIAASSSPASKHVLNMPPPTNLMTPHQRLISLRQTIAHPFPNMTTDPQQLLHLTSASHAILFRTLRSLGGPDVPDAEHRAIIAAAQWRSRAVASQ